MHLGIEIGGTKLQLAVGDGKSDELVEIVRLDIIRSEGASGILDQIKLAGRDLISRHSVEKIGIGFGGPVDMSMGVVLTSHQVSGWDGCRLSEWCVDNLGLPALIGNDCDVAALAEAKLGAGRRHRSVFYVTVGTGVGGGLVVDGKLFAEHRRSRAEIGHLRPSLSSVHSHDTVEAQSAGPGIANSLRRRLASRSEEDVVGFLLDASGAATADELGGELGGDPSEMLEYVTARDVGSAARAGNREALDSFDDAMRTLGWAIAQTLTLTSAEIVVVGGGVSLSGDELFFKPLRNYVESFVFPPLKGDYEIVQAQLGEEVVLHGALALVADQR